MRRFELDPPAPAPRPGPRRTGDAALRVATTLAHAAGRTNFAIALCVLRQLDLDGRSSEAASALLTLLERKEGGRG